MKSASALQFQGCQPSAGQAGSGRVVSGTWVTSASNERVSSLPIACANPGPSKTRPKDDGNEALCVCTSLLTPMRQRAAVPTAHPSTHVFESQRHILSSDLPPRARRLRRCGRERWTSISQRSTILAGNGFSQHEPKPHPHGRRPPARIRAGLDHPPMCPSGTAIE